MYVILVLFLARPLALLLSLLSSPLNSNERLAAAWFGPRGFASVVYGLLVLGSGVQAPEFFRVISIVIVGSIIAHSTTDTPIARWFKKRNTRQQATTEQDKKHEESSNQQQLYGATEEKLKIAESNRS